MNTTGSASRELTLALPILLLVTSSCARDPTPTIVPPTVVDTQLVPVEPTPEPTPLPTSAPPVILQDDFEGSPNGWYVSSDSSGSSTIEEGKLLVTVTEPNRTWYTGHPDLDYLNSPFDLTVSMTHEQGPRDSYGAVNFRFYDANYAAIYVNGDGLVSAGMFLDGEYLHIIPWTQPSASLREPYILRLIDSGRRVAAYLNGELVFDIPFEELPPGGISLFVGTYAGAPSAWSFDDIKVDQYAP